jgi:hypothetical protein
MLTALLVLHGLVGVALLGAITHQTVSVLRRGTARNDSFPGRYAGVRPRSFTAAIVSLYVVGAGLGAVLYPSYRLSARVSFEEMSLAWAIGLFELKEHFGGIGLGLLPMYAYTWRRELADTHRRDRVAITLLLFLIVWWNFLVGHVVNNIRGLP